MPALLEVTLLTPNERPSGLLGIPIHGYLFHALESVSASLSARVHAAEVKGFRVGQCQWEDMGGHGQVRFQLGILDDQLLPPFLAALEPGRQYGLHDDVSLGGEIQEVQQVTQETYADLYHRHADGVIGRDLHMAFRTPTTFRTTDLDMPFPVPKTVYYGLQRRWEHFSDLHFGPELNDWIGRAVRVKDFQLRPRTVHFKGARGAALTATTGTVTYTVARPGDVEPAFVRLLTEYANYSGVGYKTAFGLGHVDTWGWHLPEQRLPGI